MCTLSKWLHVTKWLHWLDNCTQFHLRQVQCTNAEHFFIKEIDVHQVRFEPRNCFETNTFDYVVCSCIASEEDNNMSFNNA